MQTTERVTVTMPIEMRRQAQVVADERRVALSTVVSEALAAYLRSMALREWVAQYEAEHGEISEAELIEFARETGVPYSPPRRETEAA